MVFYKNLSGESGVYQFEIDSNFIKVRFQDNGLYLYNYAVTAAQVKTLYNEGSAVRFGPLEGLP